MLQPLYSDTHDGPGFVRYLKFVKQIPDDAEIHKRLVAEVVPRIQSIRFLVEEFDDDGSLTVVDSQYHEFGNVHHPSHHRNHVIPPHIDEASFRLLLAMCDTATQNDAEVAVWRFFWNLEVVPAYQSVDGGWLCKHFPNYMQHLFMKIDESNIREVYAVMKS